MRYNRRITFNEMQEETLFGKGGLQAIVHADLEMTNVCTQWVPYSLTTQQKAIRVKMQRSSCATRCQSGSLLCLPDESCFLHDTSKKKKNAAAWSGNMHQYTPQETSAVVVNAETTCSSLLGSSGYSPHGLVEPQRSHQQRPVL